MAIKSAKAKGYRGEVSAVKALRDLGFDAERIFGSGAYENILGPDFKGDISLTTPTDCYTGEVKVRAGARGFVSLYNWLEQAHTDFLLVKGDRRPWLMVLPMDTVERLLGSEPDDE